MTWFTPDIVDYVAYDPLSTASRRLILVMGTILSRSVKHIGCLRRRTFHHVQIWFWAVQK